jgi:hypothetical protein
MSYCQPSLTAQQFAVALPAVFSTFVLGIFLAVVAWKLYCTSNIPKKTVNLIVGNNRTITISAEDGAVVLGFGNGTSMNITFDVDTDTVSDEEEEGDDDANVEQEPEGDDDSGQDVDANVEQEQERTTLPDSVVPSPPPMDADTTEKDPHPTPASQSPSDSSSDDVSTAIDDVILESKHCTPHASHCRRSCKCKN